MIRIGTVVAAVCVWIGSVLGAKAAERPNVVWLLSEDNSKHYLKLFDDNGAPAPHIEKMAKNGVCFDRAFSCSPVCSVARTTLMTTAFGPKIATQYHRKLAMATLPPGLRMFPEYLRKAGYYTTNNSKKDYNAVEGKQVWDESSKKASWRKRPAGTPFFHMESNGASHESSLHFSAQNMKSTPLGTDPKSFALAPYFPDTPTFRYTHARYHDRMGVIDKWVGSTIAKLEEDGLLDDTFVFYFGDHGGVLPRGKGYVYESGLHVPLVVRVPKNFRHLVGFKAGSRTNGFVSFVDFGPTVLKLAGVEASEVSDGKAFLGSGIAADDVESRDETFGYADRFDEKYEFIRTLRKGKYKYMRNYQAFYPDGLQNNYRYRMLAFSQWRSLYNDGKLNDVQSQFFLPKKAEALYDLENDPHEVNNLAGEPEHAKTLLELRANLQQRVRSINDLSLFPESVMIEEALANPVKYGAKNSKRISRLLDVIDLAVLPFAEAKPKLLASLQAEDSLEKYWALQACSTFGGEAKTLADAARSLLKDDEQLVRVRAAEFLAIIGAADPRPTIMEALRTSKSSAANLITLNTVVFLQDGGLGIDFEISKKDVPASSGEVERRLLYLSGK